MNRVGKAVLLVLALSCSPSFPVADGAQISCASNAECPEGWACNTSRSLCVPAGQTDATAPVITDFAAHPARVAAGVTLHVDFAVSEDIQARRVNARLVAPDGSTRPLACSSADARGFSCTRLIDGSEAPAGTNTPHSVLVTVEDEAANPATASTAVLLDFEPPRVAAAQPSYQPAPGNPLGAVSAAKEGTRLSLTLSASEALDVSRLPTLVARQGAGALAFTLMPGSFGPGGATFTATIPPGTADGRYLPSVTWRDVAGNEATEELKAAELRVLTSAPVLLVRQAQVQLLRSPLGGEAAEVVGGAPIPAGPYFALTPRHPLTAPAALPPDTFSLAGGALRRVRIWSDPSKQRLLGALEQDVDGSWPRAALAPFNVPYAWVTGLDEAGNESAPVRIQRGEWVATPRSDGGRSTHATSVTAFARETHDQDAPSLRPHGPGLGGLDGVAIEASSAPLWRPLAASDVSPGARDQHALAFDARRNRLVLFGGGDDRTWEWTDTTWTDVSPFFGGPSARTGAALFYDAVRERVLLFGGSVGGALSDELWEWSGAAWSQLPRSGPWPQARYGHGVVWDTTRRRAVLVGGQASTSAGATPLSDVWEWDGRGWTPITPAAGSPALPGRSGHALGYDPARERVALYGGLTGGLTPVPLADLWEWSGAARTWKQVATATPSPGPRYQTAFVFHPTLGKLVLFGGATLVPPSKFSGSFGEKNDLWTWDGTAFAALAVPGAAPVGRHGHAVAWVGSPWELVISGGVSGFGGLGAVPDPELWSFSGGRWRALRVGRPPAREGMGIAYDSTRARTVVFGGQSRAAGLLGDVWEWDGAGWLKRTEAAPSARTLPAMAFNAARGRTVLYGGYGNGRLADLWEWDGTAWTNPLPTSPPGVREGASLATLGDRRVALVGGQNGVSSLSQETWTWDGVTFVNATPAAPLPPGRKEAGLAFDASRSTLVLFGGSLASAGFAPAGDTWEWKGTYQDRSTATGPSKRSGPGLAYDSVRSRSYLFGGQVASALAANDLWSWSGGAWTAIPLGIDAPAPRAGQGLVHDTARDRLLLFGGRIGGSGLAANDLYEWDRDPSRQPAVQLDVTVGEEVAVSELAGVSVRARAGGRSQGAGPVDGAALHVWDTSRSRWSLLGSSKAGTDLSPLPLDAPAGWALFETSDASLARALVSEASHALSVQVRPAAGAGTSGEGTVSVDYLEVRLQYESTLP